MHPDKHRRKHFSDTFHRAGNHMLCERGAFGPLWDCMAERRTYRRKGRKEKRCEKNRGGAGRQPVCFFALYFPHRHFIEFPFLSLASSFSTLSSGGGWGGCTGNNRREGGDRIDRGEKMGAARHVFSPIPLMLSISLSSFFSLLFFRSLLVFLISTYLPPGWVDSATRSTLRCVYWVSIAAVPLSGGSAI